ncbi:glycosyltransferase [Demequina pelophila]|uniref:glycosyltransferase n=1 Tax=Demequina pelophila TaxID=1638984 RepID=UPI000784A635|nr:glycosyltransferase [Demequina pelophila]
MTVVAPDSTAQETGERTVVHRVVLPEGGDPDTLPLYLDFAMARPAAEGPSGKNPQPVVGAVAAIGTDAGVGILGRRSLGLEKGSRVSFATYFNAFPASYWRRWTDVDKVRLSVELEGEATVVVYKSNSRGESQRVTLINAVAGTSTVDLPLAPFGDGGWYWFDLHANDEDVVLTSAEWSVASSFRRCEGTASIGITTFNRPDYCVAQLKVLGSALALNDVIDRVFVIDQGNKLVQDEPGFEEAQEILGDRLALIRQGNLGGSGGFARGMYEASQAQDSTYVLLLDDDVVSEPEGIRRAVMFADFCRQPSIVGGHMFSMYSKAQLHSWAERVNKYRFFWGPFPGTEEAHDFAQQNLSATRWLHRRFDAEFNGWWMCLIPVETVRAIGLAMPVFIKWDDCEFGLRAARAGYPTVTLPGAAVWHVPWTDKDDTIDWQAYYHQRNRWLMALIYSPYMRGGSLIRESFQNDIRHLLQLQYSAVELRLKALEDLLNGPAHLHRTLGTSLPEVRAMRAEHPDARVSKDPAAYPLTRRHRPPARGRDPERPHSAVGFVASAITGAMRQMRPVRAAALEVPEERVAAMAAKWWRLSHLDSAVVTSADGTGASLYVRDPEKFRSYLMRSAALHRRLAARWNRVQAQYQAAHGELTSPEAWQATFEANAVDTDD